MKIKYDNHPDQWKKTLSEQRPTEFSVSENHSLDAWAHRRIRDCLEPLFKHARNDSWLTIGDGRFGADARHIIGRGIQDVHASDIVDDLLRVASEKGLIQSYSAQNAENLTFEDDSFDFVYCKESYHHFPRPYVAVYEMLRVCRRAVVLIEPRDQIHPGSPFSAMKKLFKRPAHDFETVGNYVYSLSEREVEKLLLGIGLRYCAFKGLNDQYVEGIEFVPVRGGSLSQRLLSWKWKMRICARNIMSALGLADTNLLIAILFRSKPDDQLRIDLVKAGFKLKELPLNPYAT